MTTFVHTCLLVHIDTTVAELACKGVEEIFHLAIAKGKSQVYIDSLGYIIPVVNIHRDLYGGCVT